MTHRESNVVRGVSAAIGVLVMAAGAVLMAQGDAAKIMADVRAALGGEQKLAAIKSLTATGKSQRANGDQSIQGDYEMALELPDKFVTKQVVAQTPFGAVSLMSGVNGTDLIQDTEMPQTSGGARMFVQPAGAAAGSADEKAAADARALKSARDEFARMTLGVLGTTGSTAAQYAYAGTADAPDGKADIIDVKGDRGFAGRLFVDQKSHLPFMFSWMAKEPIRITQNGSQAGSTGRGSGPVTFTNTGGAAASAQDRDKLMQTMRERMKEAEANAKVVEYRVYYGDWKTVDGVQLPHKFQESIAGEASTEITIDKYKVNAKIDPKRFEPKK